MYEVGKLLGKVLSCRACPWNIMLLCIIELAQHFNRLVILWKISECFLECIFVRWSNILFFWNLSPNIQCLLDFPLKFRFVVLFHCLCSVVVLVLVPFLYLMVYVVSPFVVLFNASVVSLLFCFLFSWCICCVRLFYFLVAFMFMSLLCGFNGSLRSVMCFLLLLVCLCCFHVHVLYFLCSCFCSLFCFMRRVVRSVVSLFLPFVLLFLFPSVYLRLCCVCFVLWSCGGVISDADFRVLGFHEISCWFAVIFCL